MKKLLLFAISAILFSQLFAQRQIQSLPPARIGIFKNGTCFVKREGMVNVSEKHFYIQAPDKVLMGTYWVVVGKESSLHSIVVKTDTFKVTHNATYMADYLSANIGQNITMYGNAANTELRKLSGKLLEYDATSMVMKVAAANGKTIITNSSSFEWFESAGNPKSTITVDSIVAIAKVNLTKQADNILASTISLERGVQWFPSYLFSVINDKEAKLELKATIANGATEYRNMPVDIIIGSPEMFFGKTLDPVCIDYLSESLLENKYDNNGLSNSFSNSNYSVAFQTSSSIEGYGKTYEWSDEDQKKEGQKLEDLYYYQLGVIDLEKNSRVIVPVMSTNVAYTEIYTADLPVNSQSLEGENAIQAYHSYLITNSSNAPFTTGAVFVIDKNGQPLAQAQLTYTPVKGSSEMQLSKAVDVQTKNEEEETGREKSTVKKSGATYYEKVTNTGNITINNYKDKKIKIRVTKNIDGVFVTADNAGKSRKIKSTADSDSIQGTEIYWEVDVEAGAKLLLKYEYYTLK